MIQVENLSKTWRRHGRTVGLQNASFIVPTGQIVGVLGDNGAGKTTLLRSVAGLVPGVKGKVLFDGRPAAREYARISYVTGEGTYWPELTVGEYGAYLQDVHASFVFARYREFLRFFSLDEQEKIFRLSTGQKARVELAAGFAKKADYYLMDEPFLGKDPFTRKDVIKLMSGALRGGETILIATHYLDDVEDFLDRALILHEGRIVDDVQTENLHENGKTLLDCMAAACGYDPERYLKFQE